MQSSTKVRSKIGILAAVLTALSGPSLFGQTDLAISTINPINTHLFVTGNPNGSPQCFIGYNADSGAYQAGTINLGGPNSPITSSGLTITPPNGKGITGNGYTGTTQYPTFFFGGINYFIVYDAANARLLFDFLSSSSSSTCDTLTNTLTSNLFEAVTHIVPFQLNNQTFLMIYTSSLPSTNVVFFQVTDTKGFGFATAISNAMYASLDPGFTHLMPYVLNGTVPGFLAYNANNGNVQFVSIPAVGTLSIDYTSNWGTNWTHFVPSFGTSPVFLRYSSLTGAAQELEVNSDNKGFSMVTQIPNLGPGASLLAPFAYAQKSNGDPATSPNGGFLAYFPSGLTEVWTF